MMTVEEMIKRKKELAYTYDIIAEKAGLPVSTVQKVLCGVSKAPGLKTLEALEMVLMKPSRCMDPPERFGSTGAMEINEEAPDFKSSSGFMKVPAKRIDCRAAPEPSDKWPRQGEYTVADIRALPDDVRVELIDGCIYEMSAPSRTHQRIAGYLYTEFDRCISEHGESCEVFAAPSAVYPDKDDKSELQPDIQVRCLKDAESGKDPESFPALVIEVLSPSTRYRDCTIKLRKYMCSDVKEYWIVDSKNKKVMVYLFDEDPLPTQYSFGDIVPIGISEGRCSIDFGAISKRLESASHLFGDEW